MSAFPGMTTLADGSIMLAFRRAPDARHLMRASLDEGQELPSELDAQVYHWDSRSHIASLTIGSTLDEQRPPTMLPIDPQSADQDVSLLRLSSGRLLMASFSWYPMPPAFAALATAWGGRSYGGASNVGCTFVPWGSYTRCSDDEGATWTERAYLPSIPDSIPLVPGVRPNHGGGCRGQLVEHQGAIYLASYDLVPALSPKHSAHLYRSDDCGESFEYVEPIAWDPQGNTGFYEPTLLSCPDGSLRAFLRTDHREDRLASAVKPSASSSFAPFELMEVVGHPAVALPLRRGQLLLVYGYRHEGYGVRARLLDALGDPIPECEELVIRDDGPGPDLGYPWAVERGDGSVLVSYYHVDDEGCRYIAGSLLEPHG